MYEQCQFHLKSHVTFLLVKTYDILGPIMGYTQCTLKLRLVKLLFVIFGHCSYYFWSTGTVPGNIAPDFSEQIGIEGLYISKQF